MELDREIFWLGVATWICAIGTGIAFASIAMPLLWPWLITLGVGALLILTGLATGLAIGIACTRSEKRRNRR